MTTASYIEFIDKINLAVSINLEDCIPHLNRLIEARRKLARIIIDDKYEGSEALELFNYYNENINKILGL